MRKGPKNGLRSSKASSANREEIPLQDALRTIRANYVAPRLDRNAIEQILDNGKLGVEAVTTADQVRREPDRFLIISQQETILDRTQIIIDKFVPEAIEVKARGVKLMNSLSMAGVGYACVDRGTEDWLRTRLSGRLLKSGGQIE